MIMGMCRNLTANRVFTTQKKIQKVMEIISGSMKSKADQIVVELWQNRIEI